MNHVFLVTKLTDDHWGLNQDEVFLVADSFENAIKSVIDHYPAPYIVTWEVKEEILTGHFAKVIGFSTLHDQEFSIEKWEVNSIRS